MTKVSAGMTDNPIVRYLRETRAELSKVTWPTRQEAVNLTIVVLIVVAVSALILGGFDFLFERLFEFILTLG